MERRRRRLLNFVKRLFSGFDGMNVLARYAKRVGGWGVGGGGGSEGGWEGGV